MGLGTGSRSVRLTFWICRYFTTLNARTLWFQAEGVANFGHGASSGISFDDQALLIRAAASHQGIALVSETLARPELNQGGLVRVLDVAWPQEFAYWLVCPRPSADLPKVVAFREWLLEERQRLRRIARPARRAARDRMP